MAQMVVWSSLRSRVSFFFTAMFPLFFLLIYGFIFAKNKPDRVLFLIPQLLVLTALSNSLFGLGNIMLSARQKGLLRRLHTTPMSKHAVLGGILCGWLVVSSISFWLMVGVGSLIFKLNLVRYAVTLWGLYLLDTAACAGIAYLIAATVERAEGLAVVANMLFFPMMFLSGLAIPFFLLPEGVQQIGRLLPSYYMVEALRAVLQGQAAAGGALLNALSVGFIGLGGYLAASAVYRWDPQQRIPRLQKLQLMSALAVTMLAPWAGDTSAKAVNRLSAWLETRYVLVVAHAFDGEQAIGYSPVYIGVQGERIAFVGPRIPGGWSGVRQRSFHASWAIPGLMDAHVHLESPVLLVFDPSVSRKDRIAHDLVSGYLGSGVTTIRSVGDDSQLMSELRKTQQNRIAVYPTILMAGPLFTAPDGHPTERFDYLPKGVRARTVVEVDDPDTARLEVTRLIEGVGPDWIKAVYDAGSPAGWTYPRMKKEVLQAIIQEAHSRKVRVTVHVGSVEELQTAVLSGADMIEHVPVDQAMGDSVLQLLKERNVAVCPTVFVVRSFARQWSERASVDDFTVKRLMPALRDAAVQSSFSFIDFIPPEARDRVQAWAKENVGPMLETGKVNLLRLVQAAIPIVAGSDAGNPGVFHGPGLIEELITLAEIGMPPEQVLRSATWEAARVLNLPAGRLSAGQWADIVILQGNPLEDLRKLKTVAAVVRLGRFYPLTELLK
jgi:imidazolonepropionase-like amidohydrolase/ABC-type multidrug transport system permease subunit